ncbi:MAG: type 1 glutamine amidotransferase [Candidatus Binataceae bacterium]
MSKIIVLQHHPVENLGTIADALETAAHVWQYVRIDHDQPIPKDLKGAGGLIVMGGPQSVYREDRFPTLREELSLVEAALRGNKPVLGVCLGAQIVAHALGAKVTKNPAGKEIGWHSSRLASGANDDRLFRGLPEKFTPFHWHGDVFEVPAGAASLASSAMTSCQAFRYRDNVYALQFHLEVTRDNVAAMAEAFARELDKEKIDRARMLAETAAHLPALGRIGESVFSRWSAFAPP